MKENRVKRLLKDGARTVGCWLHLGSPTAAEILSQLGFDWVMIDTEHGPIGLETVQTLMQAMRGTECVPFVRVAWNDPVIIKRTCDCGAYGVMVPMVCSKDEAAAAVKAVKFPPLGIRGIARSRAQNFGMDYAGYLEKANDEVMLIAQVEHITAVENLEGILSVEGIDVIFIGPGDLSISMGYPGKWDHPKVQEAIDHVVEQTKKAGIPLGTVTGDPDTTNRLFDRGFQFLCMNGDIHFMLQGARAAIEKVKR